ncbi:protein-arginine kinase [Insulibacter thermoxylanivorax]|uniref:Protein-arginine kinase n=1 Tax=Insulibacter thermoxylanivorax TaxID=2749268 RepID=A0A916QI50_9BACL|nr:protein arginine kinase [Insulibacter thermoxylanivorax]GFR38881.1 protein-arginine kinase [Insulibacter thermoxylanivorax]
MANGPLFNRALSDWMQSEGPDRDIVFSSRVRLARNLRTQPFPMLATNHQSGEVLEQVRGVMNNQQLQGIDRFQLIELKDLNELQKRVLVEKHLISPNLANEARNGAVILSENESISIMVNEEDHLRIQCLYAGFQIREAWELASRIDDIFESQLEYAFDEKRGYLTSCPTNVGTGLRASVMMHLPALVITKQINRLLPAITQVGLAVRGLYGEGSEAMGNLFQISNQITLGQSEEEILDNLYRVAKQIIAHERTARQKLLQESRDRLIDRVNRSYGILAHAHIMDSKEAAQRLSDVRLGIDLGLIQTNTTPTIMNELIVMSQPGFLQQLSGSKLSPEERDVRRAELIRSRLKSS